MVRYNRRRYTRLPYELSRSLRRISSSPDIQETIIIHSDSEEEENRINDEIQRLKRRMDALDEEKRALFVDLAKKYQERERVRVARHIRINNNRLRREFESRLLPTIESVAHHRQSIIHGARDLFNEIDDNLSELPPTYESIFRNANRSVASSSTHHNNRNSNCNLNNNDNNNNENDNNSDSDIDLPDVDSIFNDVLNK